MSKNITMSISQFMEMERGNISLKEIAKENGFKTPLEKLINNEDFQFACITLGLAAVVAIANPVGAFATTAIPATTLSTTPIVTTPSTETMKTLLNITKNVTYGTCAFAGIHEVRAAIKTKSWKKIPAEILKYGLAFSVVFFADDFFKLVSETVPNITCTFSSIMDQVAYSNSIDLLRLV